MAYNIFFSIILIIIGLKIIIVKHIGIWGHRFDLSSENEALFIGLLFISFGIFYIYISLKK
jgi:hypothetical protein